GDDARHRFAVVHPDLQPHASRIVRKAKEVVVDAEALRLRLRELLQPGRGGPVEVAPGYRPDVAGDTLAAPAEVVRRGDVREKVEAELVAQVQCGLDEPCGNDNERRLAVGLLDLDGAGDAVQVHEATP